jgi:hypothetical protein
VRFISSAQAAAVAVTLLAQSSLSMETAMFSDKGEAAAGFDALFVPAILHANLNAVAVPVASPVAASLDSFTLSPGEVGHPGVGTYSIGYRLGNLDKFSVKGFIKSGEGDLLVGNESDYREESYPCGTTEEPKTCKRVINPWRFSCATEKAPKVEPFSGQYVVIKYEQAMISAPNRDTDYELLDIYAFKTNSKLQACHAKSYKVGSKSKGNRTGRLVKLSLRGNAFDTFEATMQEGNSGNLFHHLSISSGDDQFVECALSWLKSGRKIKIKYDQSFFRNPLNRDTTYDIVSIEPAATGGLPQ